MNANKKEMISTRCGVLLIRRLLCILLCSTLSALVCMGASSDKMHRIAVFHSYSEEFPAYADFNKMLDEEFRKAGVNAEIGHFYLAAEKAIPSELSAKGRDVIDNIATFNPELLITDGDQATSASLSSQHPLVKRIPIVFSGVNFPKWQLLEQHPNVTGVWDKPNYLKTVEMIEQLLGSMRVRFFYDNSYLASEAIKEVAIQLKDRSPETHEILSEYISSKDSVIWQCRLSKEASEREEKTGKPCETEFYFTNLCKETGRDVLWAISGFVRNFVFVITKYDYRTMNVGRMASTPAFSVITEGMGYNRGILGGYMTTWETQINQTVSCVAQILLAGKTPESIPIIESKKSYVVDYDELVRWDIPLESLPDEYEIMNLPLHIKYRSAFVTLFVIVLIVFCFFILYPMMLYLRELKKKRRAQTALIREREYLSLAMGNSDIYAWKYEESSGVFVFDDKFFERLNIPVRTYTPMELADATHPEDMEEGLSTFYDIKNHVGEKQSSSRRFDFNGMGYVWYELRYFIPSDASASGASIVGLINNIQEYKDREEELKQARDLAAQAELKQSFLANMSHEIRTPLNSIVGFSNILASDEELSNEERGEFVETINTNCELLLKLIDDILEISRIESGNIAFQFAEHDMCRYIDEVYDSHKLIIPAHIQFIKDVPAESLPVFTDIGRTTQIVTNFLSNAAKFTPSGSITLGYTVDNANRSVSIYVEDTGIGIPKDQQKMIFDRFYKQDEFGQGTGLGLYICLIVAKRLNGDIILESEVGKGSRLTLRLPF